MTKSKTELKTRVVIGPVRFSYANVWEPKAMEEGQEKKYSVSVLIPKSAKEIIAKVQAAIDAATEQGKATLWSGKIPPKFLSPLHDGDEEKPDDEVYKNHFYISAKSKAKPGIVDADKNEILDKDEFYSGCYGYVSLNFFPFKNKSVGVGAGLGNLMKTKDGEPLGSKTSANEDFADVEVEEEDFLK